jgi:hypothetical protein
MRGSTPAHREVMRVLGGRSARAFLEQHPTAWYADLAVYLRTRLVPIRLQEGLGLACKDAGDLAWFARDSFVRELRHTAPGGWKRDDPEVLTALIEACAGLRFVDKEMEEHADRAVGYLLGALFIPDGWLPETPDDPHLVEAFDVTRDG